MLDPRAVNMENLSMHQNLAREFYEKHCKKTIPLENTSQINMPKSAKTLFFEKYSSMKNPIRTETDEFNI